MKFPPSQSTKPNGGHDDKSFRYDQDAKAFPSRAELPQIEGTPPGAAWFWGPEDQIGRLNLLTKERVKAANAFIKSGTLVSLNLPLDFPATPAFGREPFKHEIKTLFPGMSYDDKYNLNTQSGTQFDGFRHFSHLPSQTFYNGTTGHDIVGPAANDKCSIHHWADHGIAGRGVLLDYWSYAKDREIEYDPFDHYAISYGELVACGKAQGVDIRPECQGGDIWPGDILLVRSGWRAVYDLKTPETRQAAGLRENIPGPHDGQRWAGVSQEAAMVDWLHDCYFSAVAGDSVTFEAWPSLTEDYYLHEYLLACWGVPNGEMWDLERLSTICKERGNYFFFVTSSPACCYGGVSTHANAVAIL
ncbi:hypothetical protein LTR97_012524 [Elasticomyces elasticus]|uniref:Cyclase n=1 Tax=Elasticomyces elasticus TaxID=574655 RepID=A0AAN7VVN3_9PEZI|nr:hypothetical protein LTR97_012524 [Elasticomyces elasticus]